MCIIFYTLKYTKIELFNVFNRAFSSNVLHRRVKGKLPLTNILLPTLTSLLRKAIKSTFLIEIRRNPYRIGQVQFFFMTIWRWTKNYFLKGGRQLRKHGIESYKSKHTYYKLPLEHLFDTSIKI